MMLSGGQGVSSHDGWGWWVVGGCGPRGVLGGGRVEEGVKDFRMW